MGILVVIRHRTPPVPSLERRALYSNPPGGGWFRVRRVGRGGVGGAGGWDRSGVSCRWSCGGVVVVAVVVELVEVRFDGACRSS